MMRALKILVLAGLAWCVCGSAVLAQSMDVRPFGKLRLVDEVDCAAAAPDHQFRESPAGASRVEQILGQPCRVVRPQDAEAAYMAFRMGAGKGLKSGAAYVLTVEYPEDQPRSVVVLNGGSETSRGFHTGTALGDTLHVKYVNNNVESLKIPLSGKYETWTHYFHLHDRFPNLGFPRGEGPRPLTPSDGFDVVIAHFSAKNDPTSRGAAVSRIKLFEVPEDANVAQPLRLPPDSLPKRHIFWREEMADGVIASDREIDRGLLEPLDWYRFKAAQMSALGMNTFSKDLLEFGACQHWDPTQYGGNAWVHFAENRKGLWEQIVKLMGERGMNVLPYYEYAGSRGDKGLGYERRCKPLTRDDAYTHIHWAESANADITDPDTYADFQKMLDLTVLRFKDQTRFAGIWIRPRWQLPMGFGEKTLARFAKETNSGAAVTRQQLIADKALLNRYEQWWFTKRRDFLSAMGDYLRKNGIDDPIVLFTADPSEPGASFPTWEKQLVTDDVASWKQILARPEHKVDGKTVTAVGLQDVIADKRHLAALTTAPLNWGDWEIHHAGPPADPSNYGKTPGVLLTHGFNRRYTVTTPASLAAFRGPSGLALVRHYSLNENMAFDAKDQPKLDYFIADMELAGPYCMMAEALAVANGDPTMLGYLVGSNFGRGFPHYVREFNANFLALPALRSKLLAGAASDAEVVVRTIDAPGVGTYLAVINTSMQVKQGVTVGLPKHGHPVLAVSNKPMATEEQRVELDLYPFQLVTIFIPE